jgi:hypothetical protein
VTATVPLKIVGNIQDKYALMAFLLLYMQNAFEMLDNIACNCGEIISLLFLYADCTINW